MAIGQRFSVYLPSEDELEIFELLTEHYGVSRSTLVRHLALYLALCQSEMPVTSKILDLSADELKTVLSEIKDCLIKKEPILPQKYRQWCAESQGTDDAAALDKGASLLIKKLLGR